MAFGNLYNDDYATCRRTYATLRFARGTDHPEELSHLLQLEPSAMRIAGQSTRYLKGGWHELGGDRVSKINSWHTTTDGVLDSRDSLRHIDFLLELLEGKDDLVRRLHANGWDLDIFVFWVSKGGDGGPIVTPSTLRRLGELGVTLGFDVYFDSDDE